MRIKIILSLCLVILENQLLAQTPSLFVSAQEINNNSKNFILIDIRDKRDYDIIKIPNSLNMQQSAISKNKYLLSKKIVLVNKCYMLDKTKKLCLALRNKGYKTYILKGGINAWALQNIALIDSNKLLNFFELTPLELYRSLKTTQWIILNFSKKPVRNKFLIKFKILDLQSLDSANSEKNTSLLQNDINMKILVISKDKSNSFNLLKEFISNKKLSENIKNLFFLEGGIGGFNLLTKRVLKFPEARKIISNENDCDC